MCAHTYEPGEPSVPIVPSGASEPRRVWGQTRRGKWRMAAGSRQPALASRPTTTTTGDAYRGSSQRRSAGVASSQMRGKKTHVCIQASGVGEPSEQRGVCGQTRREKCRLAAGRWQPLLTLTGTTTTGVQSRIDLIERF